MLTWKLVKSMSIPSALKNQRNISKLLLQFRLQLSPLIPQSLLSMGMDRLLKHSKSKYRQDSPVSSHLALLSFSTVVTFSTTIFLLLTSQQKPQLVIIQLHSLRSTLRALVFLLKFKLVYRSKIQSNLHSFTLIIAAQALH